MALDTEAECSQAPDRSLKSPQPEPPIPPEHPGSPTQRNPAVQPAAASMPRDGRCPDDWSPGCAGLLQDGPIAAHCLHDGAGINGTCHRFRAPFKTMDLELNGLFPDGSRYAAVPSRSEAVCQPPSATRSRRDDRHPHRSLHADQHSRSTRCSSNASLSRGSSTFSRLETGRSLSSGWPGGPTAGVRQISIAHWRPCGPAAP